ncbi:MAG: hypothetical protein LUQ50_15815, partial [Methanospirillum sp.]|uniref:hypothetical protein n=1 Tax=Methanospirillum sp. TaxID=45200 RepID=UPI00236C8442
MIILHGFYSPLIPDQFILYAEDTGSTSISGTESCKRRKKNKPASIRLHPAVLPASDLLAFLARWKTVPPRFEETSELLSFPTLDQSGPAPLCSPEYYNQTNRGIP